MGCGGVGFENENPPSWSGGKNAASQALGLPQYGEQTCMDLCRKSMVSGAQAEMGKKLSIPSLRFSLLWGAQMYGFH